MAGRVRFADEALHEFAGPVGFGEPWRVQRSPLGQRIALIAQGELSGAGRSLRAMVDAERETVVSDHRFRRATGADRDVLNEMTLAGVRYWGHDTEHPEAYAGLVAELAADDDPGANRILVWEDEEGIAGFVDLRDRGEHVELLRMFLRTELIGRGHGRALWDRAVDEASRMGDRMLIMSDPRAAGFYEAMGARPERTVEAVPGFLLTVFWHDLT